MFHSEIEANSKKMQQQTNGSQLQDHDVLYVIMSYLDFITVVKSVSSVCVAWNRYSWQAVDSTTFLSPKQYQLFKTNWKRIQRVLCKRGTNLIKFRFTHHRQFKDCSLRKMCKVMKKLQEVDLHSCVNITDESLQILANNAPDLTSLNVGYCHRLTDKGLKHIVQHCVKLERLDLSGNNLITMDIFDTSRKWNDPFTSSQLFKLQAAFARLTELKSLRCKGCELITPSIFVGLRSLEHLEFGPSLMLRPEDAENYPPPLDLLSAHIDNMTSLDLQEVNISEEEMECLRLRWASCLKHFKVSGCNLLDAIRRPATL